MSDNIGTLYFEDRSGTLKVINENISQQDVFREITRFVKSVNQDYKIYYVRSWNRNPTDTVYDVGSHVEFFIFRRQS